MSEENAQIKVTLVTTGADPIQISLPEGTTVSQIRQLRDGMTAFLNGKKVEAGEAKKTPLRDGDVVTATQQAYNG